MDRRDAQQIAEGHLTTLDPSDRLAIDDRATLETEIGWVFHIAPRAPAPDEGPLPGAQPIFVDRDGRLHVLATAWSIEEQLDALRADTVIEEVDERNEVVHLLATHRGLIDTLARTTDPDERTFIELVIAELEDEYRDRVPEVAISRCPFTGDIVWYPIDVDGLDGLWWRADDPVRPATEFPSTVVAVTGGVVLAAEDTPDLLDPAFRREPGPESPTVLPEVLRHDGVIAVVSTVPIGPHLGFATVYYAEPAVHASLPPITEWGCTSDTNDPFVLDRELRPWIEAGRLGWIAPFDPDLHLHTGLEECPYLEST